MARSKCHVSAVVAVACCLAVAVAALPLAAAATCPASSAGSSPANNADDTVVKWALPCDQGNNEKCDACDLWTQTAKPGKAYGKFVYSRTYTNGKTLSTYRAKILPTVALSGIESIAGKSPAPDKATFDLWSTALKDARAGKLGLTGVAGANHPVVWINSLNARSKHQVHAHVGKTQSTTYFDCVNAKGWIKSPPALKAWDSIAVGACNNLSSSNKPVALLATTAKAAGVNDAIRAGLKKVGAATADITTDPAKMRTGVLVQPHPKNVADEYLVVLITGSGVNDYTIFGDKP